jgi:hypothetical protein
MHQMLVGFAKPSILNDNLFHITTTIHSYSSLITNNLESISLAVLIGSLLKGIMFALRSRHRRIAFSRVHLQNHATRPFTPFFVRNILPLPLSATFSTTDLKCFDARKFGKGLSNKANKAGKLIESSDSPIARRHRGLAKKSLREINKMEESIEDVLKQFRTLGLAPETIRSIDNNTTKFALFLTMAMYLGVAYVTYRVLRWAWRTLWVTDQDPAVAEWEKSNDTRKL